MCTRTRRSCAPQARVGYLFYEYKSTNTDTYVHTLYMHTQAPQLCADGGLAALQAQSGARDALLSDHGVQDPDELKRNVVEVRS